MQNKLLSDNDINDLKDLKVSTEELFQIVSDSNEYTKEVIAIEETLDLIDTAETILYNIDDNISNEEVVMAKLEMGCSILGISLESTALVDPNAMKQEKDKDSGNIKNDIVKRIIEGIKILYRKAINMIRKLSIKVLGVMSLNTGRFVALNMKMLKIDKNISELTIKPEIAERDIRKGIVNNLLQIIGKDGCSFDGLDRITDFQNNDEYLKSNMKIIIEFKDIIVKFLGTVKNETPASEVKNMLKVLSKILLEYKTKHNMYVLFNKSVDKTNIESDTTENLCIMTRVQEQGFKGLLLSIPKETTITKSTLNKREVLDLIKSITVKPTNFTLKKGLSKFKIEPLTVDKFNRVKYFTVELSAFSSLSKQKGLINVINEAKKTFTKDVLKSIDKMSSFTKELDNVKIDEDLKIGLKPIFSYLNVFATTVALDSLVGYVDIDKAQLKIMNAYVVSNISDSAAKK